MNNLHKFSEMDYYFTLDDQIILALLVLLIFMFIGFVLWGK